MSSNIFDLFFYIQPVSEAMLPQPWVNGNSLRIGWTTNIVTGIKKVFIVIKFLLKKYADTPVEVKNVCV